MSFRSNLAPTDVALLTETLHAEALALRLESLRNSAEATHEALIAENLRLADQTAQFEANIAAAQDTSETLKQQISFLTTRHLLEQKIHDRLIAFYSMTGGAEGESAALPVSSLRALLNSTDVKPHWALNSQIRQEAQSNAAPLAHAASVIMPTYNRAPSIVRAVRSALTQSIPAKEVIVADDASTDSTLKLLRDSFPDDIASGRLILLACEKGGVCAMRNAALAVASGEVIAFLDSDNFWHEDHLLWALALLEASDVQSVYTGTNIHHLTENWSKVHCSPYDRKALLSQNFIDLNCFVHRTGLYTAYGGFDTDLTRLVDWEYIIRLTKSAAALRVPVATVEYFLDKEGLANISFTQSLDENALKIQFKHREEMIALGAVRGKLKARIEQMARKTDQPLAPEFPPASSLTQPTASVPALTTPVAPPAQPDHNMPPYLGGIPLFVVVPPGISLPATLPTWLVLARYIHLHGQGQWSEAFSEDAPRHDGLPEGNYWAPDWRRPLPSAHQLATLTAATELTKIDLAIGSASMAALPTIAGACFRNQVVLRHGAIEAFLFGQRFASQTTGKVLRLQDSEHPDPQMRDLTALLGQDVNYDEKNQYFTFGTAPKPAAARPDPQISQVPPIPGKSRILTLAQKFAVGGVERNTIEIARQLQDDHDCLYLTLEPISAAQGSLCYQANEACLHTIDLAEIAHHEIYPQLLRHLHTAYAPDALWICNGSMWLSANAPLIREIFSDCGIVDQQVYDTEVGWINRYQEPGVQSFDRFIAINGKIQKKFIEDFKMDPARIDLIYSAINGQRFLEARARKVDIAAGRAAFGLPIDKKIFTFMGRLVEQKRPLDFLEVALLSTAHQDQHFALVGNGEQAREVEQFLADQNLTNVTWIRNVPDTTTFWPLVDAYLVTSVFEGLPIALLEAISMGVPVFATDVGDIRPVVEKYSAGFVTKELRDPEAFTRFLQSNIDELKSCAQELSPRGIEIIEFFSAESIAKQFADSFKKAHSAAVRVA